MDFGHDPALSVPPLPLLDAARQLRPAAPVGPTPRSSRRLHYSAGWIRVVHGLDAALAAVATARAIVGGALEIGTEDEDKMTRH